jgi:hypothetical protein
LTTQNKTRRKKTHPMEVDHNLSLLIPPPQPLPKRANQPITHFARRRIEHQIVLMLQVHVEREHVPAEQVLPVRRVEPEGLDLALCLHTNISKLPASSGGGVERRRKGEGKGRGNTN